MTIDLCSLTNNSYCTDNEPQKRDVSLQTTNDILTDEAPEFEARPPLCHKNEMIPSTLMFRDVDKKMGACTQVTSAHDIVDYVRKHAKNDLFKVRAIFTWIVNNIQLDVSSMPRANSSNEILNRGRGDSQDYCRLFADLGRIAGLRVKQITGFVRNADYRPGYHFKPGKRELVWHN